MTHNQTLPNLRKILTDNWSLLKINNRLKHVFKEQPTIAYRLNKNLRYVIGENSKVVRKQKPVLKNDYCKPCFSRTNNLCCKQVVPATNFKCNVTLKIARAATLYRILIRMFKMSVTVCWEIRNQIQC